MDVVNRIFGYLIALSHIFASYRGKKERYDKLAFLMSAYRRAKAQPVSRLRHKEYVVFSLGDEPILQQVVIDCPECAGRSSLITIFGDKELALGNSRLDNVTRGVVCVTASELDRDIMLLGRCATCKKTLTAILVPTEAAA